MIITRNHYGKAEFVKNQLEPMAKIVDPDVQGLMYSVAEQAGEEYVYVVYWSGYVKKVTVTADSFRALVLDVTGALE